MYRAMLRPLTVCVYIFKNLKVITSINFFLRWWKDVLAHMGLDHIRDRVIECYTWSYAVYHEKDLALARMIFAKLVALTSVLDDTYDVHAYTSIEECRMLNVAIQGLDTSLIFMHPINLKFWIIN